jgi:predicted nucleic acid-binding protein
MGMPDPMNVYWDACAWLGLLNEEQEKHAALDYVWQKAKHGQVRIWTSAFCLAEVNRVKCENLWSSVAEENDEKINSLFDQDWVEIVYLDSEIARLAKRLLRIHEKLKKPTDAVHLATAVYWNLMQLHTYDGSDLLHLNGKVQTLAGESLTICKPDLIDGENLITLANQQGPRDE